MITRSKEMTKARVEALEYLLEHDPHIFDVALSHWISGAITLEQYEMSINDILCDALDKMAEDQSREDELDQRFEEDKARGLR